MAVKKEVKPVTPLKDLPGYCRSCAGKSFALRIAKRELIRKCNGCSDEIKL